jgi:hypothetical protein
MKKAVNLLILSSLFLTARAQQSLTGSWTCPLDPNEGFDSEILLFTTDGAYQATTTYLNGEEYGIEPTVSVGRYEYDGRILHLYDLVNDNHLSFPVERMGNSHLTLTNPETQESFKYDYSGEGEMSANQRGNLQSWENYRRLGGTWHSKESILKVLPSLGIIIIRQPNDPNFFKWGQYTVAGDLLSISEISAEQTTFYRGNIKAFGQNDLRLESGGEEEDFQFKGQTQLDETELYMVQQYMNMTHRLNMDIIDAIDGVQDYIWRRVDEHGNVKY